MPVLLSIICLLAGFSLFASGQQALAQEQGAGPTSLFLTYKCPVENRAAFRAHMESEGLNRFESWKKKGVISDYLILFSSFAYANPTVPDAMVRLELAAYTDVAKWKEIERTMPAGLSAEALILCKPLDSYLADLAWQGGQTEKRYLETAIYVRNPIHFTVAKAEYGKYFEGYVKPQFDGWVEAGALSWWGAYHNQLRDGDAWDLLVLYQYKDLSTLAQRDIAKQKVRAELRENNAEWVRFRDNKWDVRWSELFIPMDPILLPRE